MISMHSTVNIRILASALALPHLLAACALPEILGGNTDLGASSGALDTTSEPTSGSSGGSSETTSAGSTSAAESGTLDTTTSSAASESETAGHTTGGPVLCNNPAHMCTIPVDCEEKNCGALGSPFDADGCLRRSCDDGVCGPGEVCYVHDVGAGCSPTVEECFDGDDACVCNLKDDCGGHYCYPEGEAPPTDCHSITDKSTCLESGCSEWKEATTVSVVNQVCTCGAAVPACLWFPGVPGSVDEPGLFYDVSTHQVVVFPQAWLDAPLGWAPCTGSPSEPAACACAAPGEDPCD